MTCTAKNRLCVYKSTNMYIHTHPCLYTQQEWGVTKSGKVRGKMWILGYLPQRIVNKVSHLEGTGKNQRSTEYFDDYAFEADAFYRKKYGTGVIWGQHTKMHRSVHAYSGNTHTRAQYMLYDIRVENSSEPPSATLSCNQSPAGRQQVRVCQALGGRETFTWPVAWLHDTNNLEFLWF